LSRFARDAWNEHRLLPSPKYIADPPRVSEGHAYDPYLPPNPATLVEAAKSPEAMQFVCELIAKLEESRGLSGQLAYYQYGQEKFGEYWRYADLTTVLWAAATLAQPKNYLEIGMNRGRSVAIVGALCPEIAVYGFDLWIPDYAGTPNPGPDFVRSQLQAVGHTGPIALTSGDSHKTVPAFLRQHPDLFFDLVTVDGDHSVLGAALDLADVMPRVKIGGILLFDDLCMDGLGRVWRDLVVRDSRFETWEYTETGYGVALAVRMGNEARLR
jgi:predicted O-methyltransferase YrrM